MIINRKRKTRIRQRARSKKLKLVRRRGCKCEYCGKRDDMDKLTVDHYMPIARGGTNKMTNLKIACLECNELKADMTPEQWKEVCPYDIL